MTSPTAPNFCPRCGNAVAPDARFCANCGFALEQVSPADEARQTRLAAAAPPPLIEKMRTARITGERKPVTALFTDVVGSTTLAESMDPEDWTALINQAFDQMSKAVFKYEGTIAQLQGDAMLAFFGAPVAHEDDPERAVRAALDMIAMVDEFAQQLQAAEGIAFRIRAGINTGPVVVGNVGSDLRYEYTALGDAMNVAARMQAAAEPGTVVITDHTYRFIENAFDVEDLGGLQVKGKTDPVHAYRVIGPKAAPERRRGLERAGIESPMVGRDRELETLKDLLGVVDAGRARVALLIGEPGIGKSRLLAEFRRYATKADEADGGDAPAPAGAGNRQTASASDGRTAATWVEARCVSYGRNLPYHLILDLVRNILGIPVGATEQEARAILDRNVAEIVNDPLDSPDAAAYLAHLLNLPLRPDESPRITLDPEVLAGRYSSVVHRLIRGLAARGPVVLVCEDIHWADQASVEMLLRLLPLAVQHPVLFLAAMRGETDTAGWKLVQAARDAFSNALTELRLEALSETDSRQLVSNLLEIESLSPRVRDTILTRAEGNPFFVEEVIRMLIERGVIERRGEHWYATAEVESVEIPETLHGLLLARIDQLPESAKRSLRVASVIGRQFPVRVLEKVLEETAP
jgi:class 3 adenylate cyclase